MKNLDRMVDILELLEINLIKIEKIQEENNYFIPELEENRASPIESAEFKKAFHIRMESYALENEYDKLKAEEGL